MFIIFLPNPFFFPPGRGEKKGRRCAGQGGASSFNLKIGHTVAGRQRHAAYLNKQYSDKLFINVNIEGT